MFSNFHGHNRKSVHVFISEIRTEKLDYIEQNSVLDLFLLVEYEYRTGFGHYM